ncbi:hypothetical protein BVRB_6g139140 [Beta vulgaris subsp. vulgaris]|nr:hypothetical protein BVRB_6g139140 [Beta vulgaris subsp. vulgaris]
MKHQTPANSSNSTPFSVFFHLTYSSITKSSLILQHSQFLQEFFQKSGYLPSSTLSIASIFQSTLVLFLPTDSSTISMK